MAENFLLIVQQVFVLLLLIVVGFLCGKKKIITDKGSKQMTDIVLYVVTPCVMISAFQRDFSFELLGNVLICALCAGLIMAGSILIATAVFRKKEKGINEVMRFAVIFSNCGFMSLPLQKAILGDDGWFYGSIFVAMFNIVSWTYGLVLMSGDKKELSIKRLAFNPGLVGVTIALILFICGIKLPDIVFQPIEYLSNLNTPIPMLIIGFYLSQANLKKAFTDLNAYATMGLRLIVIPLLALFVMSLCKVDPTITVACVIASSAPTAATTTMFSAKFNRNVELSVSIVAATTLISIISMPVIIALSQSIMG